jgi:hypothetical protein
LETMEDELVRNWLIPPLFISPSYAVTEITTNCSSVYSSIFLSSKYAHKSTI